MAVALPCSIELIFEVVGCHLITLTQVEIASLASHCSSPRAVTTVTNEMSCSAELSKAELSKAEVSGYSSRLDQLAGQAEAWAEPLRPGLSP